MYTSHLQQPSHVPLLFHSLSSPAAFLCSTPVLLPLISSSLPMFHSCSIHIQTHLTADNIIFYSSLVDYMHNSSISIMLCLHWTCYSTHFSSASPSVCVSVLKSVKTWALKACVLDDLWNLKLCNITMNWSICNVELRYSKVMRSRYTGCRKHG